MKKLLQKAIKGEILTGEELKKLGFENYRSYLVQCYKKNGVEFCFFRGKRLVDITINGTSIEELKQLQDLLVMDSSEDLEFRITKEALISVYKEAKVI
ncbi:MAG: hypothetical protein Q4G05_00635 [Clostridia bacterium]|nr:hypothetical protein [Clostridia bacterium]